MFFVRIFLASVVLFPDNEAKSINPIHDDSISSEIAFLRHSVSELSTAVQTLNESVAFKDTVKKLQGRLDSFERVKERNVMFYAVMKNNDFHSNKNAILVFDSVIVNEGDHYNQFDGIFVAPVKGVYLFSWTVTGDGSNFVMTELSVENKIISTAGEYNPDGSHLSGSMIALCHMETSDHAWIRTTTVAADHHIFGKDNYPQTSFMGLLISH